MFNIFECYGYNTFCGHEKQKGLQLYIVSLVDSLFHFLNT